MSQAMHATQSAIDEETRLANAAKVQAIRATHAHSAPANGKASDALAGLAAALAPLLGGNLHDLIREAVAEAMASFTPAATAQATAPGQVVVIEKGKEPRALSGIHHKQAGKIIKLAGQRGLNVLMVGPAGCGKTVLAKSVSQAHERPLTVISCSAGMSEAQLLGRLLPMGAGGAFVYVESPFMKAYANGGVILLDEIDAADSNLLLVINAALANGGVEIEARAASGLDTRVERHAETIILAAANTWGTGADTQYVGRAALDAATLDRFYRVAVDYDTDLERAVCENSEIVEKVQRMRSLAQAAKLRRVLSTRMIVRVDMATRAGIPMREAFADELAAWSADERSKVGA
jgi:MoxR-like ATPase